MKKVIDVSNIEKIYQLREDQRGTFHDVLFDIIDDRSYVFSIFVLWKKLPGDDISSLSLNMSTCICVPSRK